MRREEGDRARARAQWLAQRGMKMCGARARDTGRDEEEESDGEEGETATQRRERKKQEKQEWMKKVWDKTIAFGKRLSRAPREDSELGGPHVLARMRGLLCDV